MKKRAARGDSQPRTDQFAIGPTHVRDITAGPPVGMDVYRVVGQDTVSGHQVLRLRRIAWVRSHRVLAQLLDELSPPEDERKEPRCNPSLKP